MELDFRRMLRKQVAVRAESTAVEDARGALSYRTLDQRVNRLAHVLAGHGVAMGDRVALLLGNRTEFVVALFAAARIGAITVPMNIREQAPGLAYMLQHCGAKLLVHEADLVDRLPAPQAVPALREWRRVLRPDGFLLLVCPDLQAAAEMIAQDRLMDVAYAGIRPYDIVFSHQGLVAQGRAAGHSFMEHKSGYTLSLLRALVNEAGFAVHAATRMRQRFELWLIASVQARSEADMRALAQRHFAC